MTGDEVIFNTAESHQLDASPDPAAPAAELPEGPAGDAAGAPGRVPEPPGPQETNAMPVEGAGVDGVAAAASNSLNARSAQDSGGGDPGPEPPALDVVDEADSVREAVRRDLVKQFEAWLDRVEEGEPPPDGLPEELFADALETPEPPDAVGTDLYTVFAGLTKLSGEIGLQGRAFRQLADVPAPSVQVPGRLDRIEAAENAIARELARRAEPDESELPASEDILSVLFDLYDRLNRGLQNFDASYQALRRVPLASCNACAAANRTSSPQRRRRCERVTA